MHEEQNTYKNTSIFDPESAAEMARLINLDRMTTQAMGGVFAGLPASEIGSFKTVLDVACGPGGWVLDVAFAHPGIEVAGIDVSQIMIDYAYACALTQKRCHAALQQGSTNRRAYSCFFGRPIIGLQIVQQTLKRLLVSIMIFPLAKVADMSVSSHVTGPRRYRGDLHNTLIQANWKQDGTFALVLFLECHHDARVRPIRSSPNAQKARPSAYRTGECFHRSYARMRSAMRRSSGANQHRTPLLCKSVCKLWVCRHLCSEDTPSIRHWFLCH